MSPSNARLVLRSLMCLLLAALSIATTKGALQPGSTQRFAALRAQSGACSCEWPPADFSKTDCAPPTAMCAFCMNAAYVAFWTSDEPSTSCAMYAGGAKDVCEKVAGGMSKSAVESTLKEMYSNFGPHFGATAALCREKGCCPAA